MLFSQVMAGMAGIGRSPYAVWNISTARSIGRNRPIKVIPSNSIVSYAMWLVSALTTSRVAVKVILDIWTRFRIALQSIIHRSNSYSIKITKIWIIQQLLIWILIRNKILYHNNLYQIKIIQFMST